MNITILKPTTVSVKFIEIIVEVEYGDEDIPYDFPGRSGKKATWMIDIDEKRILDYENEKNVSLDMKVDGGTYTLIDENGEDVINLANEYAPHGLSESGVYLTFDIDKDGFLSGVDFDIEEAVKNMVKFSNEREARNET